VRDDLGVGVRREAHALRLERLPQRDVVFDDAVVHDGDVAGGVRMGVVLAGPAVRRPARVADPRRSREGVLGERFVEAGELADGAHDFDGLSVVHGEPRRVVPPVFELAQAVDQDRRRGARSHVSNDSAHGSILELRAADDNQARAKAQLFSGSFHESRSSRLRP
jgi:hypothetical protein